ncbi:MAG: hypothetical protein WBV85_01980 [Solirubrobacteraceae bacterium]
MNSKRNRTGIAGVAVLAGACVLAAVLLVASPALAVPSAWWHVGSSSFPTQMQPGKTGYIFVSAVNRGYTNAEGAGSPIVLTDELPPGVEATEIKGRAVSTFSEETIQKPPLPDCTYAAHSASCTYEGNVLPYDRLWMVITVKIAASPAASEVSSFSVVGGGATSAAGKSALELAGGEPAYGLEKYELSPEEIGGGTATQAGDHPFQLTTNIGFDKTERLPFINTNSDAPVEPALPKDVNVKLPPGLIGNPTPFPQCTAAQFTTQEAEGTNACPQDSVVGFANITIDETRFFGIKVFTSPVFNLVPEPGEPARFGFLVYGGTPVYLDTSVRTGRDYGVTVHVGNITELAGLLESEVTFWGVPGDKRHDNSRGWWCGASEKAGLPTSKPCDLLGEEHPEPFLVMPTSCTGPLQSSVETDSWKEPANVLTYTPSVPSLGLDGCNKLGFNPGLSVTPDSQTGSTASGLSVDLHVPQAESLVPTGLSEANVKNTTVALPEGLVLNPSAADGLQSCSLSEIGLENALPASCPDAAKVGTVTIHTPLLPEPLTGEAYLASQDANPFGSLVALYVVAEDPKAGVLVKLAGEVHLTETGQIVSTFKNTPQLPFEDFELKFFGGDRAPLATPAVCGSYTTHASLEPWSGTSAGTPSSTFLVTSGPDGSSCSSQLGFAPSLTGGTENIQAGELTPFTTTMSRNDGEQPIQDVKLTMPQGLMGSLTGVTLCGEEQANAGTCGANSLIGHTIVSVGIGGDPFSVTGGRVYITGPYHGAPFGLSIVEPAIAGPFNLGTVVVRATIEVDPHTAQLTVTTDPSGPYAIPQILDGIPLQIRHVNVTIDRQGFTFNPTSCKKMSITGDIASSQGSSKGLAVPFQVANCANLAFKPSFTASTSGKTSRANGASLHVKLTYPKAAFGTQANVKSARVELPKALPSRLTTLNHACTDAVFNKNPADCPAESRVGQARATTPILPVPLEGPAYFVSHGGAKFPELIVALQGYGVTVYLQGETFISKTGITSSTFKQVPDVPVSTFELTLPEGKYSALAANRNLCQTDLIMPTTFGAQNGTTLKQNTRVEVQGCPNTLTVLAHKISHRTITLTVAVPQAGNLTATANGLTKSHKSAAGRGTLTVKLTEQHAGTLHTTVQLRFTPASGKQRKILRKAIQVRFP